MKIEIIGLGQFEETAKAIFDSQKTMKELILNEIKIYGQILERQAKEKHLSGPTTDHSLSVQTGRLRASIRALISEDHENILIRFGTDVPYAAIHEFGGTLGTRSSLKSHKTLSAMVMPQRSFLGSSIDETYPDFQTRLEKTLEEYAARGLRG